MHIKLNNEANMAKIALIVGSVRQERHGIKVVCWMEEKLKIRILVFFSTHRN